jgi:sphingolipid delta-4 desaturase
MPPVPQNSAEKSMLTDVPEKLPYPDAYSGSFFKRDKRNFHFMDHDEPHATRRRMILEKHPEVKELMKQDPFSLYLTMALVATQTFIMSQIKDWPWWSIIISAFVSGAVLSHALYVLIHDLTHYTAFKSRKANQYTAILANLGQGIPSSISFGRYHADHHIFLGRPNWDPDLPTQKEIGFFTTPFRKFMFILTMPFFYGFRPYFVCPKPPSVLEFVNMAIVFSWDAFMFYLFGGKSLCYLILGTAFGLGLNPVAAHIIAEHYEFIKGQDTYSYYGIMNVPNLNIGYHIEHHDFPNIPWRKLPKLREIAPEFYNTLPQHKSYLLVMYKYIFDKDFGAWCRIGRHNGDDIKQKRS